MARTPRYRRPRTPTQVPDQITHNDLVNLYIRTLGEKLSKLSSFSAKMVVLESLTVGLIASVIFTDNKDPQATLNAFIAGIKSRLDDLLKGDLN